MDDNYVFGWEEQLVLLEDGVSDPCEACPRVDDPEPCPADCPVFRWPDD